MLHKLFRTLRIRTISSFLLSSCFVLRSKSYHTITFRIELFEFSLDCSRMKSTYTYWLLYNQSLVKQNFLDNMNAPLKMSIDALRTARQVENAIANWILKDGGYTDNPQV